jgi:cytochrome P450 family 150 subfamily A5
MADFDAIDFFQDPDFILDPYPYYEFLREHGPVRREPHHGVMMVTGLEEAVEVYRDTDTYSSCTSVTGPFPGFPVPLEGHDVSALIEAHRDELPFSDQLPTFDPPKHTDHRALLMRLITPKRLKENEEFMWRLADRQIDEFHGNGEVEIIGEFASPFAMLVIADLLGVPESDHEMFRAELASKKPGHVVGRSGRSMAHSPLEWLYARFTEYIEECRRAPRDDVLTGLATATFPDGTLPDVIDVVRIAANLFAAGQETTVRLLANSLQVLGERPDLQDRLRSERDLVPNFVEESLRFESPVKGDFRLTRVPARLGGVDIPAGTTLMVLEGAANRDPQQFACPADLELDRPNGRQHVGFGFGIHACAGAPLARAEGRVSLERILDRTAGIRISEAEHGPAGARRYRYTPIFMLRGLEALHLEFTPVAS